MASEWFFLLTVVSRVPMKFVMLPAFLICVVIYEIYSVQLSTRLHLQCCSKGEIKKSSGYTALYLRSKSVFPLP